MSRLGAVHFYSLYADFVVKRRNSFSKNFSCFSALVGRHSAVAEFSGGQVPQDTAGGPPVPNPRPGHMVPATDRATARVSGQPQNHQRGTAPRRPYPWATTDSGLILWTSKSSKRWRAACRASHVLPLSRRASPRNARRSVVHMCCATNSARLGSFSISSRVNRLPDVWVIVPVMESSRRQSQL